MGDPNNPQGPGGGDDAGRDAFGRPIDSHSSDDPADSTPPPQPYPAYPGPDAGPPPIGPGHPDFGKPVDPRYANVPPLDPNVSGAIKGPLTVGETVAEAFRLYGADWTKLWACTAVIAIPWAIIVFVLRDIALPSHAELIDGKIYLLSASESASAYNAVSTLTVVLQLLVLLVSVGATYRILLGRRLHHPANVGAAFGFALERAPKLFAVSIGVAIAVLIGFVCIIIPGIYLGVAFTLAVPVLMAEDLGIFQSMSRSMELIRGLWWHAFGCILLTGILSGIVDVVLSDVVVHAIVKSSHSVTTLLVISELVNALVLIVISPLSAALATVLYTDMLLRRRDPHLARLLA